MKIWIDADACPQEVKGIVILASVKNRLALTFVANRHLSVPPYDNIKLEVVPSGPDEADDFIATNCVAGDLVITADIPLAARVVERGAAGLNPRGELYTEENVESILSMRNFMEEMRTMGLAEGGPSEHRAADTRLFANALDRWITRGKRAQRP